MDPPRRQYISTYAKERREKRFKPNTWTTEDDYGSEADEHYEFEKRGEDSLKDKQTPFHDALKEIEKGFTKEKKRDMWGLITKEFKERQRKDILNELKEENRLMIAEERAKLMVDIEKEKNYMREIVTKELEPVIRRKVQMDEIDILRALAWTEVYKQVREKEREVLRKEVEADLLPKVVEVVRTNEMEMLRAQVEEKIRSEVERAVGDEVKVMKTKKLKEEVAKELRPAIEREIREKLGVPEPEEDENEEDVEGHSDEAEVQQGNADAADAEGAEEARGGEDGGEAKEES
ncbi:hypothetical protein B0J14DRAFT_665692 [Halenospora varia]|nr:hypothetical protein B0J14DRAFT_665692 [Halenospora varia]